MSLTSRRVLRIVLSLVGVLLLLIVVSVGLVIFAPNTIIQHFAGSKGSASLGRHFAINGDVKIHWDWTTPEIEIGKITLANLPQGKNPNMVEIDNLDFHIKMWRLLEGQLNLPDIMLDQPKIVMEKFDPSTKNWEFPTLSNANAVSHAALPSSRNNFPIIGQLTIHQGKFVYMDKTKNLLVNLNIDTASGGGGETGAFVLSGKGLLQGKPFDIQAQGGSLDMLRNAHQTYPLNLHLAMGDTVIKVDGTFDDPVKMEGVNATFGIKGDNLADLFYITAIPLPPTPHYQLGGHIEKHGSVWTVEKFAGDVGHSDLSGNLTYDTSGERGLFKAQLTSHLLDMKDLRGFLGKSSSNTDEQKKKSEERVILDIPIDLSRMRTSDLEVDFKAVQLLAPGLPMNDMHVGFDLKEGVLKLDPVRIGMAKGQIDGTLLLDGSHDIPHMEMNLSISKLSLKQFFEKTQFEALASGFFGGHFQLAGDGKSLAKVMGSSNGRITLIMSGGTISQLIVDAAGFDFGKAVPRLLGDDTRAGIRCAVGDFSVKDGMVTSNALVFDTTVSQIAGKANINLKDEMIDVTVEGHPKQVTLSARTPITVTGHLKKPDVSIDPKEISARGASAAALSVFLTPVAALVPFIELGLGKESDCRELIQQARSPQP